MAQEKSPLDAAAEYWTDAWQRRVLFLETLNERGNTALTRAAKEVPHVLTFTALRLEQGGRAVARRARGDQRERRDGHAHRAQRGNVASGRRLAEALRRRRFMRKRAPTFFMRRG